MAKHSNETANLGLFRHHAVRDNVMLSVEEQFNFYGYKIQFKSHMINRSLHPWSLHMKFMNFTESSFHKFHIK